MGLGRSKQNTNGSALAVLRSIKQELINADFKSSLKNTDLRNQSNEIVSAILEQLFYLQVATGEYNLQLHSKTEDDILARIVFLINELKKDQSTLDEIKTLIQSIQSGASNASSVTGSLSKDDLDQVKQDIIYFIQNHETTDKTKEELSDIFEEKLDEDDAEDSTDLVYANKAVKSLKDEKIGDYQDSTVAQNFDVLSSRIQQQIDLLNENISKIQAPGFFSSILSTTIGTFIGNTFAKMFDIGKGFGKTILKTASTIFNISKTIGSGILSGMSKSLGGILSAVGIIGAGIGKLGSKIFSGIKGLGSKIGGAIMSPFKAIGGFFSKLNPFGKKKKDKEQAKKEKAKERVMNIIADIIEKIWKTVEPFINWVSSVIKKFIIIPITIIALKVLLIVAAITLLAIGLYLAYRWVKKKISEFIEYVMSGQLWEDIKAGMLKAWEWMKDFGKWIWNTLLDFGKTLLRWYLKALKFIWVDIPVWIGKKIAEFSVWVWTKLCEFGKWLYDIYIDPYVIQPFKKYIWEPVKKLWKEKIWPKIEPFVISLTELKNKIVKAFSAWDTNKSIWENLKNISGIIKDSVLEWWETSPFKVFYEKYLEPGIKSIQELVERIKSIWANFKWDENKSFLENLKDFWNQCWTAIKEWWSTSIIKTYWDKLVDWLTNVKQKIVDWWNNSEFGKKINGLIKVVMEKVQPIIEKIKEKAAALSDVVMKIPFFGFVRPFGALGGKAFKLSASEADDFEKFGAKIEAQQKIADKSQSKVKNIDKEIANLQAKLAKGETTTGIGIWKKDINVQIAELEQQRSVAKQQVENAMQSIDNIQKERVQSNQQLNQASEEVASRIAAKEATEQETQRLNAGMNQEMYNMMVGIRQDVEDAKVNNSTVIAAAAGGSAAGAASVQPARQYQLEGF